MPNVQGINLVFVTPGWLNTTMQVVRMGRYLGMVRSIVITKDPFALGVKILIDVIVLLNLVIGLE
jgi:hypothetical protein